MDPVRFTAIIRKEFLQALRDPRTLTMVLLMPVIQLILFGYALNTVIDHIPTVIFDESRSASSRGLVDAFQNSGYFDVKVQEVTRDDTLAAIDSGQAKAALMIPPDFSTEVSRGDLAPVELVVDGSDPNTAQTALFSAGAVAQAHSASIVATKLARVGQNAAAVGGIDLRTTVLYNPRMLSTNFMIPGLVGMILQTQAVILTAFAIVRERERGTLEQILVTPIRSVELMLGKILPNVVIAVAVVSVTLFFARVWFGVRIVGSLWALFLLTIPFLLFALGLGLFISLIAQTQMQAQQMAQMILMPSMLLSGFFTPLASMPIALQAVSALLPLTYYLQILRGIIVKGVGLQVLWPQFLPLLIFGAGVFAVTSARFNKRIA